MLKRAVLNPQVSTLFSKNSHHLQAVRSLSVSSAEAPGMVYLPLGSALSVGIDAKAMTPEAYKLISMAVDQRKVDIQQATLFKAQDDNFRLLYRGISQILNMGYPITFRYNGLPISSHSSAEHHFKNHQAYKMYSGRSPIANGAYYFGTKRRGGVLGDIYIDLDSEEFTPLKNKLKKLKALGLSKSEIIERFVKYVNSRILFNSPTHFSELKMSQKMSCEAGMMPLSTVLFLGYGDCRPHSLTIAALLNDAGIECEYANFDGAARSKGGSGAIQFRGDHSTVIYKAEDGVSYLADSYSEDHNNMSVESSLKDGLAQPADLRYKFLQEQAFPTSYVKDFSLFEKSKAIKAAPTPEVEQLAPSL